jgi:hypothetical protein
VNFTEDIFGPVVSPPVVPPPKPLQRRRASAAAAATIAEEEEGMVRQEEAYAGIWMGANWRNTIRTNPHVKWSPPQSLRRRQKPVEITEL